MLKNIFWNVFKVVCFLSLFYGVAAALTYEHGTFNGNLPDDVPKLLQVVLRGSCPMQTAPGEGRRTFGRLGNHNPGTVWWVTDSVPGWFHVENGDHFWVHKTCTKIVN